MAEWTECKFRIIFGLSLKINLKGVIINGNSFFFRSNCMKCVHCRKAKGKRYCPAKQDDICPKCCGEFRGIDINCPPDCEFFVDGQKNHQERIDKLRIQKEGIKTYVKRAELFNKNTEVFALVERYIATSFRSNRRIDNRDLQRGLEQVCKAIETEIKGVFYEYESENSYANEISYNIMAIMKECLKRYESKGFTLETGLEIMKEYLSELMFYINNEPGKQSYLIQIARSYPEDAENPNTGQAGGDGESGLIIT